MLEGHLWEKPTSPHAMDDEFEDVTLDPAWDNATALDFATALTPYSGFSSFTARVQLHTNQRRSWLMSQYNPGYFSKPYTLPTNALLWARMRHQRSGVSGGGVRHSAIFFSETSAGNADLNNMMIMYLAEPTNLESAQFQRIESGANNTIATTQHIREARGNALEYVMIHKVGATFHGWVMGMTGEKVYLGSSTYAGAGTLDRLGFYMGGSGSTPGYACNGIDFIRVVESATYLP
jgi:hypothetical protein